MTDKTCARFYQPRRRRVREPQQVLHAGLGYRGYDLFLDRESGHQVHGIRVDVAAFLEPNEETTQASSLRVHIAAGGSATLTARPLAEPQGARCKIDEILFQVPRRYLVNICQFCVARPPSGEESGDPDRIRAVKTDFLVEILPPLPRQRPNGGNGRYLYQSRALLNEKQVEQLPQIPHLDKRKTSLAPATKRAKMFLDQEKRSQPRCSYYEARLTGIPVRAGEGLDGYDGAVRPDDVSGVDASSGFEVIGRAPRETAGERSGLDGQPDDHLADAAELGRRRVGVRP